MQQIKGSAGFLEVWPKTMSVSDKMDLRRKAYVCVHVGDHVKPILLVSWADGDWSFLCGDLHPQNSSAYRVVGIGHLLDRI